MTTYPDAVLLNIAWASGLLALLGVTLAVAAGRVPHRLRVWARWYRREFAACLRAGRVQ